MTGRQPYIVIPGTNRQSSSRKVACNRSTGIKALVIRDRTSGKQTLLKVSLMRQQRVMYLTLTGHQSDIIDLEFLQCSPSSSSSTNNIHVLGSCDRDGVVYLWFLYVALDKINVDVNLRLLKKYSFFTLRRSTAAFYTRIRLAGSTEEGTLILVPNDGANVRVVRFACEIHLSTGPKLVEGMGTGTEEKGLDLIEGDIMRSNKGGGDERAVSSKSTLNSSALVQARRDANDLIDEQEARGIRQVIHVDVVREGGYLVDESENISTEFEQIHQSEDIVYQEQVEDQEDYNLLEQQQQVEEQDDDESCPQITNDDLLVEGEGLAGYTTTTIATAVP